MPLRDIAAVVTLAFYFINWLSPNAIFVAISAIAALVWAVLIVIPLIDHRTTS